MSAGGAMSAFGDIVGGVGSYDAGRYNKKSDYAAATASEQDGSDQAARVRMGARAAIGGQIAAQGSNGFQQGTGSALDALQQSQVSATLDAINARRKAEADAQQRRQQGDVAMATGKNALVAGLIKAGSDAASLIPSGGSGAGYGFSAPGAGGNISDYGYVAPNWASPAIPAVGGYGGYNGG